MMNAAAMSKETRAKWMTSRVIHGAYMNGGETAEHYIWRTMAREKNGDAYA
jgi:hypothetical protein